MDRYEISAKLENIIGEYLSGQALELIELTHHQEGNNLVLRILVDRSGGGINLGECALLNQEIGKILDLSDCLDRSYLLEVSSPGIDRPLKRKEDFARCINKRVRFFLSEPLEGKLEWAGQIQGVEDQRVLIDAGEIKLEVSLSKINKAKREI